MSALHICSTLHTANGPRHTVLIDGEIYTINHHLLAALRTGDTVEDLGLEPDDDDPEADEYPDFDRACSSGDRAHQLRKEAI